MNLMYFRNLFTLPVNSGARAPSLSLSSVNSLFPLLAKITRCVFTSELNRPTAVWENKERQLNIMRLIRCQTYYSLVELFKGL